jgi:hypothetical protein
MAQYSYIGKLPTDIPTIRHYTDVYTGDGVTQDFTLSDGHTNNTILVFYNGVCLVPDVDYSVNNTNLSFTFAPTNASDIVIRYYELSGGTVTSISESFVGDGLTSTYTIKDGHTTNSVLVFYNGVCLTPVNDYTVSGTTLTLNFTPINTYNIMVRYYLVLTTTGVNAVKVVDTSNFLTKSNNLSDLADTSIAVQNLGIDTSTFLTTSNNLSDVADGSTARNNLNVRSKTELHFLIHN